MPLGESAYDVVLGYHVLDRAADLLHQHCPAHRYAIIADSQVAAVYGEQVRSAVAANSEADLLTFPAGEWNKSRESWSSLTDQLLHRRLDRDAVIIGLGGGVAGDLSGFVAATYLRGVRHVQIPTSLLAMVDSAVGGKTGIDTPFGKNLVGAFHQPQAVLVDISTLATLPPVQLAAGMAEVIKHGVVADAHYFERIVRDAEAIRDRDLGALAAVVQRSIEIKCAIVAQDVREHGHRAVLNFGHTIAHALEALLKYELLHGEAVAIGMVAEAELGERLGVTHPGVATRIREALEVFGLPTEPPMKLEADRVMDVMRSDKKVRDGTVRFALPQAIGAVAAISPTDPTIAAPEHEVLAVLEHFS